MKIVIGIMFLILGLTTLLKGSGHCFSIGFHWEGKFPKVWTSHGRDYSSAYRSSNGRDALFQSMIDDYRAEEKKK